VAITVNATVRSVGVEDEIDDTVRAANHHPYRAIMGITYCCTEFGVRGPIEPADMFRSMSITLDTVWNLAYFTIFMWSAGDSLLVSNRAI
jgi:hypothetical protein